MKTLQIVAAWAVILLTGTTAANASIINFSGLNLASVSSPLGQNFGYTNGSGVSTGIVNVRLIVGTASSVQPGSSPDTNGFYALQSAPTLPPLVFRFTFDAPRTFTITENESQATIEVNSFALPSGSWTLLSAANTTTTSTGSNITFVAANNSPPYGAYSIVGTGSVFDFQITNSTGFPVYGSAISINVISEVPIAPVITINRAVRLQWQTQIGVMYQPQYSYGFDVWFDLGPILMGNGQIMELCDVADFDPKKFYRVRVQ